MKVVIPLAGPDFERPDGSVKAELLTGGEPLLRATLERRPWWTGGLVTDRDLVFVLKDSARVRQFVQERLKGWYPGARVVLISETTAGAALSALAGVALIGGDEGPLCVDLVDIAYQSTFDPVAAFAGGNVGAVALVFPSSNPVYSYLRTDADGEVVEAAEKRVISGMASAGTYFFASSAGYAEALAHNLRHREAVTHKGLFFVCPLYNGVIAAGRRVLLETVSHVQDIKTG